MTNKISLFDYNFLQIHQRAVIVCSQSRLLDMVLEEDIIYTLYEYGGYYIEVMVDNMTKRLINIIAFKHSDRLDKYIERIDIHELFTN